MPTKIVRSTFFFILLALTTCAFVFVIHELLQPLFWAAVLAVIFRPTQRRLERVLRGRRSTAGVITLVMVILIIIIPVTLIGLAVANEAMHLYEQISSGKIDLQAPLHYAERALPTLHSYADRLGIDLQRLRQSVLSGAVGLSQSFARRALQLGQDTLQLGVIVVLTLYLFFFFVRDGDRLVEALIHAWPMGDVRERRLVAKFAAVSRATIKGNLVVALVQGAIGGILFASVGITAPFLWGVIMAGMSLLPAVGAGIVWLPAAVILLLTGHIAKGIVVIAVGALVISLVDNVLRPLLVGHDTQMPDYLILISTLGGIAVFGISGFVIGPIVAGLFLSVWQMVGEDYGGDDSSPSGGATSDR